MEKQLELLYRGAGYDPARDNARLQAQTARVLEVISDHQWRPLAEIARLAQCPEASASAQLRHLRKERFGAHKIERRHVAGGLFEYRLAPCAGEGS